jgi:hypothetical protein
MRQETETIRSFQHWKAGWIQALGCLPLAFCWCLKRLYYGAEPAITGNPTPERDLDMYLIAIAWLYVALLVAISDTTVVGGVLTFLFFGLGPLALFMWLVGTPARRRRRLAKESKPGQDNSLETRADQ